MILVVSVILSTKESHVTIIHDALDLAIQGPLVQDPSPSCTQLTTVKEPLRTCSNLFIKPKIMFVTKIVHTSFVNVNHLSDFMKVSTTLLFVQDICKFIVSLSFVINQEP